MIRNRSNVVLDTNILVSAIVFDGKPARILTLVLEKHIVGVTSKILLSELLEILIKKFDFSKSRIKQVERKLVKAFKIVYPKEQIFLVRDVDDNRVLEAAVEGNCEYIITGDNDLLELKKFQNISILKPDDFLTLLED